MVNLIVFVNSFPSCNNLQLPLQVKKRVVMVMARQHPGESPASYVVQGLIDFLVSKHKIAQELREKLIFKVVFYLNPFDHCVM